MASLYLLVKIDGTTGASSLDELSEFQGRRDKTGSLRHAQKFAVGTSQQRQKRKRITQNSRSEIHRNTCQFISKVVEYIWACRIFMC